VTLLSVDDVAVTFGGSTALAGLSFDVGFGSLAGLIGPNGAGKTTLFNVVCGLLAPDRGSVVFDGRDLHRLPPHRRTQLGLARTFQQLELFGSLTVLENVKVAGDIRDRWSWRSARRSDTASEARHVLELVGLAAMADVEVSSLPTGQARSVELGRALMTHPQLLLLDEPASGQDDGETEVFGRLLRRLVDDGVTVLLVEHDMSLVMSVCDTVHVLDLGTLSASGSPQQIQRDPSVLAAYLGADR